MKLLPSRSLAALEQRTAEEADGGGDGVELLTLHRAKGLEWEAVFLPSLEEGSLPVAQALEDDDALAEERRLLYVGITRARQHLVMTWARHRPSQTGRPKAQRMSRFLAPLIPRGHAGSPVRPGSSSRPPQRETLAQATAHPALIDALRAWRTDRAQADGVPAYVVLHDATLIAIAEQRPGTVGQLLGIAGIGPTKAERYGTDIIAIVRPTGGASGQHS